MASEEVLEENNQIAPILLPVKKKGRIKKFFSNDDVVLFLFSLGASAIIITLMIIAAVLGVKIPTTAWWF